MRSNAWLPEASFKVTSAGGVIVGALPCCLSAHGAGSGFIESRIFSAWPLLDVLRVRGSLYVYN